MAVDIITPKATVPEPPEPERVSGWEFFRWIYRFFYSKTVGLVLILAMAVLVLIGTLAQPQATARIKADPELYQQFLDQHHDKLGLFGGLTGLFDGLGLFDVYRSPLFIVVSGLLAASILACTAHRLPLLWRNWRHPRLVVPARAYEAARYRASVPVDGGDVAVMSQVREVLAKQRYRVLSDPDHPKALYADRFAWGGMGAAVSHLSFVIIIAAVVISMNGGIDKTLLVPTTGAPVAVGEGTSLSVAATSYESSHTAEGRPTDFVSHLMVTKNGKQVAEKDVRVNSPLRVGNVSFYQSSWVDGVAVTIKPSASASAAVVEAADADGVLFDDFAMLQRASGSTFVGHPDGYNLTYAVVGLDQAQGLSLLVAVHPPQSWDPVEVTNAQGTVVVQPGQALLELRKDGLDAPLDTHLVDRGGEWTVGDYVFTFDGSTAYPYIQVRQDPGEPLMWVGSILLVVGLVVVFACRHRRLWVTWDSESSRLRFASTDKSDTAWARRFHATVETVAQAVDSAAQHGPSLGRSAVDDGQADEQGAATDPDGTKEKTDE